MRARRLAMVLLALGMMLRPLASLECAPRGPDRHCCEEAGAGCHERGEQVSCCTGDPYSPEAAGTTLAAVYKNARELTDVAILGGASVVLAPAVYHSPLRGQERVAITTAAPPLRPLRL